MMLPPLVSLVLLGTRGFSGVPPRTVISPPVLALAAVVEVPLSLPPPQPAASSATAENAATATVRVVPRMDVRLREVVSPPVGRVAGSREVLPIGGISQCI